jgi:NFU1 iron-sulfur cluster scaffold homolog, mitochondrial
VHREVGAASAGNTPEELTVETVEAALDEIRGYLFADGGDIRVLEVDGRDVKVQFEGSCASCSSQETTMAMGVERVLRAHFGDKLGQIISVEDEARDGGGPVGLSEAAVEGLLSLLRPAVRNYGGKMEVDGVEGGVVRVQYEGPDAIWTGVRLAIQDKFGDDVSEIVRG